MATTLSERMSTLVEQVTAACAEYDDLSRHLDEPGAGGAAELKEKREALLLRRIKAVQALRHAAAEIQTFNAEVQLIFGDILLEADMAEMDFRFRGPESFRANTFLVQQEGGSRLTFLSRMMESEKRLH
jgi:hypothetical protein